MRVRASAVCGFFLSVLIVGQAVAADTDVVINEVFYVGSQGEDWIELKNTGATSLDITTWRICTRFAYTILSSMTILDGDDLTLTPGEILTLQVPWDLNDASSDLGLYSLNAFADTSRMVDFLQWGTTSDVGRSSVAASKGIWTEVAQATYDFIPVAGAGQSAAYDGSDDGGGLLTLSSDYVNAVPTRGGENITIPVEASSWAKVKDRYRGD